MKKVLALVLALAIFVMAMPIGIGVSALEIKTGEADGKTYVLGDVLYSNDFEGEALDTLPEGWEAAAKSWGWNSSGTGSAKVTENSTYGKVLTLTSTNQDYWISMPEIKTRNYVYEASLFTKSGVTSGAIGIANGMYGGIYSAGGATYTGLYLQKLENAYYRSKGTPTVQKYEFTRPSKNIMANAYKIKFVCFDGINYLYIDDNFIAALPQGQSDSTSDWVGFYVCGGTHNVTNVTVTEIVTPKVDFNNVSLNTDDDVGLNVDLSFDKANKVYQKAVTGKYTYSDNAPIKFGMVYAATESSALNNITVDTNGATNVVFTNAQETYEKLYFSEKIENIESENLDKFYEIRPYVLINSQYIYGESRSYSPASLANNVYSISDKKAKEKLSTLFKDSTVFKGENKKTLTFTMFSDFHYEEGKYIGTIAELRQILARADESGSAFVMSGGDFCNNFIGSPELTNTYLNYQKKDGSILTAYNVYGNHELESANNSMEYVTPTLTNDKNVVWGTADGKMDTNIGYYYFEENGFRIVCIDTNYSKNADDEWEHNQTASYGPPSGNTASNSMGDVQLEWFEDVLTDAANKGIPCIVVGHAGFSGKFATSASDAVTVRDIYARVNAIKAGTVIMSINGHEHTNNQGYVDGVFYFDTNTVLNGRWVEMNGSSYHYKGVTYDKEVYDDEGNLIEIVPTDISTLYQGRNTYFFADPLSAVITVDECGTITVDGTDSSWRGDIVPTNLPSGKMPYITSGTFWDGESLSHVWSNDWEHNDTHHWKTCENESCTATDVSLNYGYETHTFTEENGKNVCECGATKEIAEENPDVTPEESIEVWDGSVATSYAGGSGTASDPYLIEKASQLAYLVSKDTATSGKYYALTKDIHLNRVVDSNWETTRSWYDESGIAAKFAGTFDGKGYSISGIHYNGKNRCSLFPKTERSTIKNVNLINANITTTSNAAGFIANPTGLNTFIGCSIDDTVSISGSDGAGYVTYTSGGVTVENCFSSPILSGSKKGAFIGDTWGGTRTFKNSIAVGYPLQGKSYGEISVENCYGTESELATVKGSLTILDAELMKGENAKTNMPNLDWTFGWETTENGYPRSKLVATGNVWNGTTDGSFQGSGTVSDPYQIATAEQLAYLVSKSTDSLGKYYVLTNDIELNLVVDSKFETTRNWFAKGQIAGQFQGTFDGDGHTISGLYFGGATNHASLFPTAKNSTIKNVNIVNASITATGYSAAALVADPSGVTTFIGCSVDSSVSITGSDVAGYITRTTGGATFENCFAAPTLNGSKAGAFMGDLWNSPKQEFKNCIAVGSPFQGKNFGKIVATNCYGSVAELATVSGTLTILDAELMKGAAAIENMPNLDWENTWMVDPNGGYPVFKKEIVCTNHSFGEWATEFEATIFDKGVNSRSCLICGEKEYEETAKLSITEKGETKLLGAARIIFAEGENIEYSTDLKNWQKGSVLTGLSADTEYNVYIRRINSVTGKASGASEAIVVKTYAKDNIIGEFDATELSNVRKELLGNKDGLFADVNADSNINLKDLVKAKKLAANVCDFVLGDVNEDGVVNKQDATLISDYLNGKVENIPAYIADINNDGVISKADIELIK